MNYSEIKQGQNYIYNQDANHQYYVKIVSKNSQLRKVQLQCEDQTLNNL